MKGPGLEEITDGFMIAVVTLTPNTVKASQQGERPGQLGYRH